MHLEGTVLVGPDFEPVEGRVVVADCEVVGIEEHETDSDDVILPAFVNAHTHIGDSIAKEAGEGLSLDELVAPPDGLKHRLLRSASHGEKVAAMARTLRYMESTGTGTFLEFREGGVDGVAALRDALAGEGVEFGERAIESVVFGRDDPDVLSVADGYGASGARDADFDAVRAETREAGKLFGIHAGERDAADVNAAMDLDPDFLVHMVHAEAIHLERLDDRGTPVVVCPRSNLVTNVGVPPIRELADRTTVALGTDNVMTDSPSMFREMEFAAKLSDLPAREILRMATVNGAEIAGLNRGVIESGADADLLVLDGDSDNLAGARDLVRAVVRRAGHADVSRVVIGGKPVVPRDD
ncbi:amidohydrolase [Halorubrum californiense DSM 19288]|uniref:Amidohydrolase n=1 Tax=Halorubrum californiense DSM 19288 TaxID=1227465 RepID=M0E722_9EURY|nr:MULTISPECIES: amidohydrolase family protein [Halorubrum]ELZ42164.1 amidohydrolase [Halorubrum californiense DSM 19288]TKX70901.1 nucleoside deaminase [Halorubrum sp. GN11GM_10-3_MGM]